MARERVPRRHAAAYAALRSDGIPAGRTAQRHQPVRRREDRLDAGRRAHVGDPRLCDLPGLLAARRAGHDDPREQLRAVHRDSRRLHDDAAHVGPGCVHVGDEQRAARVADPVLHDRAVDPRRPGRVSDEAALHQRRAAPVSRGAGVRRRAGRSLREVCRCGRHVQGARPRLGSRAFGHVRPDLRRELHEAAAGALARVPVVLALPHAPGLLVLLARRPRAGAAAEARGRRHPPARAVADHRLRDDRCRWPDGHPHRRKHADRRECSTS